MAIKVNAVILNNVDKIKKGIKSRYNLIWECMEESGKGIPDRFNLKTDMNIEVNEKAIHKLAVYGKYTLKRISAFRYKIPT